jgi:hypothetical protein
MTTTINASLSGGLINSADTSGILQLQTANTAAVTIDASQNVGVGTASPTTKLDVTGNLKVTNSSGSTIVANRTANPGSIEIQYGGTQTAQFSAISGGGLEIYTGSSPALRMSVNAYGIGLGTAVPSSGTGITFPATQSASSNANTLDDYEEGTWTPTITGSTSGSGSPAPSGTSYLKVGRVVTIQCRYDNITFPTFAGNLYISLPFAPSQTGSGSWYAAPIYFYPTGNWGLTASFAGWLPQISVGTNQMVLGRQVVNGDRQEIATSTNTTLSGASGIYLAFSITYLTDA